MHDYKKKRCHYKKTRPSALSSPQTTCKLIWLSSTDANLHHLSSLTTRQRKVSDIRSNDLLYLSTNEQSHFYMYSSYIQIQIAYFRTGIRVLYIVLLQNTSHRRSASGTRSDVLQANCHQSILCGLSEIFHQYIDFVTSKVSKGEKNGRPDLTRPTFSDHQPYQDTLATARPRINE